MSLACPAGCPKTFRGRNTLAIHLRYRHPQEAIAAARERAGPATVTVVCPDCQVPREILASNRKPENRCRPCASRRAAAGLRTERATAAPPKPPTELALRFHRSPWIDELLRVAAERSMSAEALVGMVVRDWMSELAARTRTGRHPECCPCRDVTPEGLGRCCYCARWTPVVAR